MKAMQSRAGHEREAGKSGKTVEMAAIVHQYLMIGSRRVPRTGNIHSGASGTEEGRGGENRTRGVRDQVTQVYVSNGITGCGTKTAGFGPLGRARAPSISRAFARFEYPRSPLHGCTALASLLATAGCGSPGRVQRESESGA
ncbi:uncharacterized protein N7498_004974 [Penicillium cinerascens]|uniref:Uncharacterized protein n=1 Tax=Penicillium cinerascens TaxID=70096 RepID=A0A9W9T045_9EURO|nr:uncharacterized protein N7498_004974 [Penicillium cinerascens]KAJ5204095.1 hypothetical protein N7498_004974 [Penicillium cinerascens]